MLQWPPANYNKATPRRRSTAAGCGRKVTATAVNTTLLKTVARQDKFLIQIYSIFLTRLISFTSPILTRPNLHYFIKIQAILHGKSMAIRLTSLHRLSNSLTNNDLDFTGYLFIAHCSYYAAWRWDIFMFGVNKILLALLLLGRKCRIRRLCLHWV